MGREEEGVVISILFWSEALDGGGREGQDRRLQYRRYWYHDTATRVRVAY